MRYSAEKGLGKGLAFWFLILGLVVGVSLFSNAGVVYNFENDFSTTTNVDTSTWSFRYGTVNNRDGIYNLLPYFFNDNRGLNGPWSRWLSSNDSNSLPFVGKNTSGQTLSSGSFSCPVNQSNLHPTASSFVVVSWLAPSTGTLSSLRFLFSDLDSGGGNGVTCYVDKDNSTGNLWSQVVSNGGSSGEQVFNGLNVNAGDRINFIVDPNGNEGSDSTRLMAEITFIPEPATVSLLVLGGLALLRRRKA
jgi:hypothetical protein